MTYTYVGDLSTDLDKARFHLGDTTSGSGPQPADGNFTDEELGGLIAAHGSWQRAVAAGLDNLATLWRRYPSFKTDGLSLNRSDIADGFAKQATAWRKKYGLSAGGVSTVGSRAPTPVDGYSSDVAIDET